MPKRPAYPAAYREHKNSSLGRFNLAATRRVNLILIETAGKIVVLPDDPDRFIVALWGYVATSVALQRAESHA